MRIVNFTFSFSVLTKCCWKKKIFKKQPINVRLYSVLFYSAAGAMFNPASGSGRLVLGFFWFLAIVILGTFNANRMAFLAIKQGNVPFQTLKEVADDRTHLMQVANNTMTIDIFKVTQSAYHQYSTWTGLPRSEHCLCIQEHRLQTLNLNLAWIINHMPSKVWLKGLRMVARALWRSEARRVAKAQP